MPDKIIIVTPPDDILLDGLRILLFDLDETQREIISNCLKTIDINYNFIVYFYNNSSEIEWLLDKKIKADAIIFNAESTNQTLVGYLAAQKNSAYFGTLKDLKHINNCAVYNKEQCTEFIYNRLRTYE